jgi:hypothetical protein
MVISWCILSAEETSSSPTQMIAQKCGYEFLSLIDSDRHCEVFVIDIVQKLVFQDEEGNIVSETDGSLVGKLIEVRFNSRH